jgi:hypothetical protein
MVIMVILKWSYYIIRYPVNDVSIGLCERRLCESKPDGYNLRQ